MSYHDIITVEILQLKYRVKNLFSHKEYFMAEMWLHI